MQFTLRTRFLLTFVFLTVLIVAVLTSASYWIAAGAVERQVDENLDDTVHRTVSELDSWLEDRRTETHFFGEIEVFKAACYGQRTNEAQARLDAYQKLSPEYENLFLADTNGMEFMDSIGGKSVGLDLRKNPVFALNVAKAQQGEQCLSDAQASPASGRPICLITSPIFDHGTVAGIAGTPLELADFSDHHVRDIRVGGHGYLAIVDGHGVTLAHKDSSLVLKYDLSQQDWGRQVLAQKNGRLEYEFNGSARLAHIATDEKTGWIILAVLPKSEIAEKISSIRDAAAAFGLGAILLVTAATWLLTGNLIGRVTHIAGSLAASTQQNIVAASQVSSASQTLAEGSGEQAASIEETSSSLEELTSVSQNNAELAAQCATWMGQAKVVVEKVDKLLKETAVSIQEINRSSEATSKVIKTIEEIAFQTNILALNAAVEAARAGEAGMGFAVVADEVRNLAQRCAEAAKETSVLIETAAAAAHKGSQLTRATQEAFGQNLENAGKVSTAIAEIAAAVNEQSRGIAQINTAVGQMDKVTQSNAATAEESAAAAEELNAQADLMKDSVHELLRLMTGHGAGPKSSAASAKATASAACPTPSANGKAIAKEVTNVTGRRKEIPLAGDFKDF